MNDYKELIGDLRLGADILSKKCILLFGGESMTRIADAIEQLVKERDAAVKDLKQFLDCDVCKNNNDECLNNGLCKECSVGKSTRKHWEWRGVQE